MNADKGRLVLDHLALSRGSTDDAAGSYRVQGGMLDWLAGLSARCEAVLRAESGNGLLELFADFVETVRF